MAAATQYSNCYLLADTNTIAGPARITYVKVVAGSATASLTLTNGASQVFYSASAVANTQASDQEINIYIPSGETATVALSGTGAKAFAYTSRC